MAYEPTKNFRQIVRQLVPGDEVIAVGSYKKGSINLEKLKVISLARAAEVRPPLCPACTQADDERRERKGLEVQKVQCPVRCTGCAGGCPDAGAGMVRSPAHCQTAPG